MNIPEGWPTRAMIEAAWHQLHTVEPQKRLEPWANLQLALKLALEAAPTSPASTTWCTNGNTCPNCGKKITQHEDQTFCPIPTEMEDFNECPASGFDHKFGSYGPNGESQCEYCGEPPVQDDEPVGYVSIDYQGHMMRNKGKATVHESNPNPAFFIGVYTRPDSELRKAATEAERLLTHLADSRRLLNGQFQILRKLRAALKEPS